MGTLVSPHIEQFYDDEEIEQIIRESVNLTQQFDEPDVKNARVCAVLAAVRRYPGYQDEEVDLDLFIKHDKVTELGQLELYRVRDFVRKQVDLGSVLFAAQQIAGVDIVEVVESIKRQLKFLHKPENRDLPQAPAWIVNNP